MAFYRLSVKHQAKGAGASALAHATYIAREGKYAKPGGRAEAHSDYLERGPGYSARLVELEASWSANLPSWAGNGKEFWDAADLHERANGSVYTEVLVSLPRELSKAERLEVVEEFVREEFGRRFVYTVAVHNPRALDGGEQPHAHIMFSKRELDGVERTKDRFFKRADPRNAELGGAKKSREWSKDDRGKNKIVLVREHWERKVNAALERAGFDVRVDRRSLAARGIQREPEPKMGPEVTLRLKRGQETEVGEKVIELRKYRRREQEVEELEARLRRSGGGVSREEVGGSAPSKVYDFSTGLEYRERPEKGVRLQRIELLGTKKKILRSKRERLLEEVSRTFTTHKRADGDTEFRSKRSGKVSFTDKGDELVFKSVDSEAVRAGVLLAISKGWSSMRVTGSKKFRRESWIQGQLLGYEVTGYWATKTDRKEIESRKLLQSKRGEKPAAKEVSGRGDFERSLKTRELEAPQLRSQQSGDAEGTVWIKASDAQKLIQEKIEKLREEVKRAEGERLNPRSAELRKEQELLWQDRYDLNVLGERFVKMRRLSDSFEISDRPGLRKTARKLERERRLKSRDRER